ncbi:MAG: cytochrome P450, partial [Crocinitomicaceae bacterium]
IFCFTYGMHRNPEYWENPDDFNPDRFSDENKKKHVPHAYMPFGAGPRLCIGNNFAMMEMQLILSMFVKRYRFEVVKDQKIEVQPLITLRPRNGIKVKIHKR